MKPQHVLIIGDGYLGRNLADSLSQDGFQVTVTTRKRNSTIVLPKVEFDLASEEESWDSLFEIEPAIVILAAGVNGILPCKNTVKSFEINVVRTIKLLKKLETLGIRSLFFSSSLIWDVREDENRPRTEYGRQKLALEKGILGEGLSSSFFRLGKVIDRHSSLTRSFVKLIESKMPHIFFNNVFLAPVHFDSVYNSVNTWIIEQSPGTQTIKNIVPKYQFSYFDFAQEVLASFGYPIERIIGEHLRIPDDELPNFVACDASESNEDSALYGTDAMKCCIRDSITTK